MKNLENLLVFGDNEFRKPCEYNRTKTQLFLLIKLNDRFIIVTGEKECRLERDFRDYLLKKEEAGEYEMQDKGRLFWDNASILAVFSGNSFSNTGNSLVSRLAIEKILATKFPKKSVCVKTWKNSLPEWL